MRFLVLTAYTYKQQILRQDCAKAHSLLAPTKEGTYTYKGSGSFIIACVGFIFGPVLCVISSLVIRSPRKRELQMQLLLPLSTFY